MSDLSPEALLDAWRAEREKLFSGDPHAMRSGAETLEHWAEAADMLTPALRAMMWHDAACGYAALVRSNPQLVERATRCELQACRGLRAAALHGEGHDLLEELVQALTRLVELTVLGGDPPFVEDLDEVEAELRRAQSLVGATGQPAALRLWNHYATALLARCQMPDAEIRQAELARRALSASKRAIRLLENSEQDIAEDDRLRLLLQHAHAIAELATTDSQLIELVEHLVETVAWLRDHPGANDFLSPEFNGEWLLAHACVLGLQQYLAAGDAEPRRGLALAAVTRALGALQPQLWDFDTGRASVQALPEPPCNPPEALEHHLIRLLAQCPLPDDVDELHATMLSLWPRPPASHTAAALVLAGVPLERCASTLAELRDVQGPEEDADPESDARRFGRLICWSGRGDRAPIDEITGLFEMLRGDQEGLRRAGVAALAVASLAGPWSPDDLRAVLLELDRLYDPFVHAQMKTAALDLARIMLLALLAQQQQASSFERLAAFALRLTQRAEACRKLTDEYELNAYLQASYSLVLVRRALSAAEADALGVPTYDQLEHDLDTRLHRWGFEEAAREDYRRRMRRERDGPALGVATMAERFLDALATANGREEARAWDLLIAMHNGQWIDSHRHPATMRRALEQLVATETWRGAPRQAGHVLAKTLLALEAPHPAAELVLNLLDQALRFTAEQGGDPTSLLVLTCCAEDALDGRGHLEYLRARERVAELVFAQAEHVSTLEPTICAMFLYRCAFVGFWQGATHDERQRRVMVAVASLSAACAAQDPAAIACALHATADVLRCMDLEGGPVWAALQQHLDQHSDGNIGEKLRAVMLADLQSQPTGPLGWGTVDDRQPDSMATQEPRRQLAAHLAARTKRLDALTGDEALPPEDQLIAYVAGYIDDVQASHAGDDEVASWLLSASQALARLPDSPSAEAVAVLRRTITLLLRSAEARAVPRTVAVVMFEHAVLLAAIAADERLVGQALSGFRAAVNHQLLDSVGIDEMIAALENSGALDRAACVALSKQMDLALEIAEAGRAKLLTALATGALSSFGAPQIALQSTKTANLNDEDALLLSQMLVDLLTGGLPDPLASWSRLIERLGWSALVGDLITPWPRVRALAGDSDDKRPSTLRAREAVLKDPEVGDMLRWVDERRLGVWVLGLSTDPLLSFLRPRKGLLVADGRSEPAPPSTGDPKLDAAIQEALSRRSKAFRRAYAGWQALEPQHRELPALIFDCAAEPEIARDVALGMWWGSAGGPMPGICPSFRLADRPRPALRAPQREITVLANPLGDLSGSILEASRWSAESGSDTVVLLHGQATCQALVDALRNSRLVIVSGHGSDDSETGARLRLADGAFALDELLELEGQVAARAMVLSCCYGANRASAAHIRREQIGLVSCLLALGVREVLAPVTAVSDAAAAVFGGELARSWSKQALDEAPSALAVACSDARRELYYGDHVNRVASWTAGLQQEMADGRVRELYADQANAALARMAELPSEALHEAGEAFALYSAQSSLTAE